MEYGNPVTYLSAFEITLLRALVREDAALGLMPKSDKE